jgi:hypothetical protein
MRMNQGSPQRGRSLVIAERHFSGSAFYAYDIDGQLDRRASLHMVVAGKSPLPPPT